MSKWTIGAVIAWTTEYFQNKEISSARLDAELLLAYVLNKKRIELYTNYDQPLSKKELGFYKNLIVKRSNGTPVAYLVGYKEFYGLRFIVNDKVLIPRPETEFLVESVLNVCTNKENFSLLEIGVGSGAVLLTLLKKKSKINGIAIDISKEAIEVAKKNALVLEVENRVFFFQGDLFTPLKDEKNSFFKTEKFDVILSNPPYLTAREMQEMPRELTYEPQISLYGGLDGLEFYYRLLKEAKSFLKHNGKLIMEIGAGQAGKIKKEAFKEGNWQLDEVIKDLAGLERVMVFSYNGIR